MILIVGGAGYIGSHINKELNKQGYKTLVLDNLSTGKKSWLSGASWWKLIWQTKINYGKFLIDMRLKQ